jgi:hypothetical protein
MSQSALVSPLANATTGIPPMRFVVMDTANPGTVLLATSATTQPLAGISQPGTRTAAWSETDANVAGLPGENIGVFTNPDKDVMIEAGAAFNAGSYLTADSIGRAIATTTAGNQVGAWSRLGAAEAGDFVPVNLVSPTIID